MSEQNTSRRKMLAVGSAGLLAGLAGCAAFRDTKGTPGEAESPSSMRESHPHEDPLREDEDAQEDDEEEEEEEEEEEDEEEADDDEGEEGDEDGEGQEEDEEEEEADEGDEETGGY